MASNLLWAHLLRKDATTTDSSPSQIPPIAPQDKTGTSMRMLIHDTQVNLEKFSTRVDGLLQHVDDCRAQVVNANKLLDVERDKVLTEILEIAHRCQSEMRAHVGTPAQASTLDLVHASQVSTEKSVQALGMRIDALQMLLQTHAHAMQSIQDQQNTLIGAVLPLVPIIHGIPPQVDQIKTAVSDMVGNAVSTMTNSVESVRSTLVSEFAHGRGYTWSSTRLGRSSKSSQRERSDASVFGPQEVNVPVSSPLDSHGHRGAPLALKRARIDRVTHHAGDAQLPRKLSRLAVPLSDPPPLLQTPRTPRQPLADLLFIPGNNISRNSTSRESMRSLDTVRASGGSRNNTPRTRRPFHPPKQGPTITRRHSAGIHDIRLPTVPGPSDRDAISKEIKIEEILEPNFTGIISINSSPMSSPPSSTPLGTRETKNVPCISRQEDNPRVELVQAPPPSSSNPDASPPKSMSLRDRRAQMSKFGRTETRRFIPLVPWSDEEE